MTRSSRNILFDNEQKGPIWQSTGLPSLGHLIPWQSQKRGSRRIVVDTIPYRWTVRPRPTYDQALAQAGMSFAVDLEIGGQTTLLVTLNVVRPDNWINEDFAPVTPVVVERAIRQALKNGWSPIGRGKAFELACTLE